MLSSVDIKKKLNLLGGVRIDYYTPDFTGRFNGEPENTSTSNDTAATYNASVTYSPGKGFNPYFTYATSTYLELGQGSELDQAMVGNQTYLQDSNLYEGGLKFSGMEGRTFASVSVFQQKRTAVNKESGSIDYFRTKGVEVEARAALHRKVSLTGAYTWQKPEQLNVPFLLGIPPQMLGLTTEDGYGGRFVGLASIFDVEAPVRVPGQPANVGSLFATYSFRRDAGVTMGATVVSSVNAGYVSGVRLPGYMVWRGSGYFQRGNWGLNLAVNNLFNEEYYQSQFLFWDVFIKPSELRTVSLTMNVGFWNRCMTLNEPTVVQAIVDLHDAYEAALTRNDVEALNAFFWDSPGVVRYGVAEQRTAPKNCGRSGRDTRRPSPSAASSVAKCRPLAGASPRSCRRSRC